MRKPSVIIALVVTLIGGAALANQLTGLGAGYWSRSQTLNASTAACVTQSDGTTCQLFPSGTDRVYLPRAIVASTSGSTECCFVHDSSLDIAASGQVTDPSGPNGTGDGDCFELPVAGGLWQGQVRRAYHQSLAGYRSGLCPNRTLVHSSFGVTESLHAPCSAGACPAAYGGGTCDTTPSSEMLRHAGIFLNCEGTQVHVRKEQTPGWSP